MQKIDMSIAIVCMTNHTAIKMLQKTNKTNAFLFNSTHINATNDFEICPLIATAKHKYVRKKLVIFYY
jgi:hypothetical protein